MMPEWLIRSPVRSERARSDGFAVGAHGAMDDVDVLEPCFWWFSGQERLLSPFLPFHQARGLSSNAGDENDNLDYKPRRWTAVEDWWEACGGRDCRRRRARPAEPECGDDATQETQEGLRNANVPPAQPERLDPR